MKDAIVRKLVVCLAEVFATGIVIFLAFGGCIDFSNGKNPPTVLQMCMTLGLSIMVSVQCFGHISGAHISPVVTVASATMRLTPIKDIPVYFIGQTLGVLGAYALLKAITPNKFLLPKDGVGFASPNVNNEISPFQGFLMEFMVCFILVLVCCSMWDKRNKDKQESVPLRLGFTVVVLALVAGPFTGANMNPPRSLIPALINYNWNHHWVYWIGPLAAGFLGAMLYKALFSEPEPKGYEEPENIKDKELLEIMIEKPSST